MPARWTARLITLLVFVTQVLAPFLHAHAGTVLPPAGAPLHLHLSDVIAIAGDRRWSHDEGRVVLAPPEVRRDASLSVAECPDAPLPVEAVALDAGAAYERPAPHPVEHRASAPSARHARGPPSGRPLASS